MASEGWQAKTQDWVKSQDRWYRLEKRPKEEPRVPSVSAARLAFTLEGEQVPLPSFQWEPRLEDPASDFLGLGGRG